MKSIICIILTFLFSSKNIFAQDDLLKMLQDESTVKHEPVLAMFKTNKLINIHTNETVRKHNLDVGRLSLQKRADDAGVGIDAKSDVGLVHAP